MNMRQRNNSQPWSEVLKAAEDVQVSMFHQAAAQICADDVMSGFRAFATDLLARDLISMTEYVGILGGNVIRLCCTKPVR